MSHEALENLSHESRRFPPSAEFAASAVASAVVSGAGSPVKAASSSGSAAISGSGSTATLLRRAGSIGAREAPISTPDATWPSVRPSSTASAMRSQ